MWHLDAVYDYKPFKFKHFELCQLEKGRRVRVQRFSGGGDAVCAHKEYLEWRIKNMDAHVMLSSSLDGLVFDSEGLSWTEEVREVDGTRYLFEVLEHV